MQVAGVDGLIKDIGFSFLLPAIGFVMAVINIKYTRGSKNDALKLRLSLAFCLLLFAVSFCVLMIQDRAVLTALWRISPILYSAVYSCCGLLIIGGVAALAYWRLRPELWTSKVVGE